MTTAAVNGIEIFYEERGGPGEPAVLLIMGLGAQMTVWPDEFIDDLVARGFRVVWFDNRDVGLSTKFHDVCTNADEQIAALFTGGEVNPPYQLADMANDAVGLLDHLGIETAHIVGASMGGMIAQQVVVDHPDRALSLTSIMSTTGESHVGAASPDVVIQMVEPQAPDREMAIAQGVEMAKVISSPDHWDEEMATERITVQYDRCNHPPGQARQLLAVLTSPSREAGLARFDKPALVVHGHLDQLVGLSGGHRTAEVLPDVETLFIEDMAHDLPRAYWPTIADAIDQTIRKAQ